MSASCDLGAALREADWESLLPRLLAHAEWRLRRVGWAGGEDREPSAMAAQQVVNTAVERCLAGRRAWSDACLNLEIFLRGVIDNLIWTEKKRSIRAKTDPDPDIGDNGANELDPSAEDSLVAEEGRAAICAAIEACVQDDPKLQDLYLAILVGNSRREDIAMALEWTPEQVSAARIKLKRRLLSKFPEKFATAAKEPVS